MDYKKKSLNSLNRNESYEEIDTRLASGWYVDSFGNNKKKSIKLKCHLLFQKANPNFEKKDQFIFIFQGSEIKLSQ